MAGSGAFGVPHEPELLEVGSEGGLRVCATTRSATHIARSRREAADQAVMQPCPRDPLGAAHRPNQGLPANEHGNGAMREDIDRLAAQEQPTKATPAVRISLLRTSQML